MTAIDWEVALPVWELVLGPLDRDKVVSEVTTSPHFWLRALKLQKHSLAIPQTAVAPSPKCL